MFGVGYLSEEKKIHITPMIIEEVTVSENPLSIVYPSYFYKPGEDFYPAIAYDRAFIYVGEHRMENIHVRRIGGTDHIFANNMRLVPIRGTVYSIMGNGRHIVIAAQLKEGPHALTILEGKNPILELYELKTGFLSKKTCYPSRIDIGLAGDRLFIVVRSRGSMGEECPDAIIYGRGGDKYVIKQYKRIIPSGWNGEWYTYMVIEHKKINLIVSFYDGREKKYSFPKTLIPESFMIPGSVISVDKDSIIMNNSYELMKINLKGKRVEWRKTYNGVLYSPRILSERNDKVVVYIGPRLDIIDKESGNVVISKVFERDITSATIDGNHLLVAVGNILYYYEITGREIALKGRYNIPGNVNGLNKYMNNTLINYISPGNMTKLIYADYSDALTLDIPVFKLPTGSTTTHEFREVTPSIRIVKKPEALIYFFQEGGKIIVADKGSKPGTYISLVEFNIPGFLSVLDEIKIIIEKLETAFKRIKIQPRIVPSSMGPYIPVIIEPAIDIDELTFVLRSSRGEIYGSSHILYNISRRRMIPIYILWAKEGIHNAEIIATVWSKRNMLREKINTKIIAEYDVPPFHLKVSADTVRIWSPFDIDAARIKFESPGAEYTIIHDLRAGWNEIDTHGIIPEQVKITLRSGIVYVVKRGSSWIQLSKP